MSVKIIYFVHGTTLDNSKHKATGWNHGEFIRFKKGNRFSTLHNRCCPFGTGYF